jgi:hypothetical protein
LDFFFFHSFIIKYIKGHFFSLFKFRKNIFDFTFQNRLLRIIAHISKYSIIDFIILKSLGIFNLFNSSLAMLIIKIRLKAFRRVRSWMNIFRGIFFSANIIQGGLSIIRVGLIIRVFSKLFKYRRPVISLMGGISKII